MGPVRNALKHLFGQGLGLCLALAVSFLLARNVGATGEADAFLIGRRLVTSLTEALNKVLLPVFVPVFVAAMLAGPHGLGPALWRWTGGAALAGLAISVVAWLVAPTAMTALAPGMNAETAASAVGSFRIFFLSLPAAMAVIVLAYALNALSSFGTPSLLRQAPRIAIVLVLLFSTGFVATDGAWAFTLASYAVAAVLLPVVWLVARRNNRAAAKGEAAAQKLGRPRIQGPAVVVLMVSNLAGLWVETGFAGRLGEGALTTLELSQRLGALGANTLASALLLAIFVHWSRLVQAGESGALDRDAPRLVGLCLAALAILQGFVALNARDLVGLVLDHGAFDAAQQSVRVMRWIAVAPVTLFALNILVIRMLVGRNASALRLLALVGVELATRVALFTVLVPKLGLVGLAAASGLSPFSVLVLGPGILGLRYPSPGVLRSRRVTKQALLFALSLAAIGAGNPLGNAIAALTGLSGPPAMVLRLAVSGLAGLVVALASARALAISLKLTGR